ncbi:hypothetical protein U0C82_03650 [Fulvimarina sp. 2208YS6-2-32]|uniref:Uncharacterized protein n=1 Tax=Fulvimarina uroteuthidis TaxID=3098149 RepID=A0ABU5HZT5_9HYPH|nr:hypothetical protein [Fulvimarina sp. 2208YS6-2-32]MDY8108243.1 hypothetical protein [Fulvimarina sp. 2208YS6-2-32]
MWRNAIWPIAVFVAILAFAFLFGLVTRADAEPRIPPIEVVPIPTPRPMPSCKTEGVTGRASLIEWEGQRMICVRSPNGCLVWVVLNRGKPRHA